ncbi:hypothetical protein M2390_001869 [Mycetocola sp. BIGb0189]|uniref:Ig-like domain-containing protein n=1 Tax=Mycetocola sp. BIGb0189 TaxID=2940604 RepID=UPI002169F14C|nr:Ig-like domain-containing protein [Mycetocola sp. BIGb0189]MCS4276675.1 hypothetical protein [Mycetocola sp. BIGb0189]
MMRKRSRRSAVTARRPRPTTVAVVSSLVVIALVVVAVVVSHGFERLAPQLESGSVWVSNGSRALVGQANTEITRLNTAFGTSAGDTQILQDPTHVTLYNSGENTLALVDPALATVTETVPLPAGRPRVVDAGDTVLIYLPESGDVWRSSVDDLRNFSAVSAPALNIGADAVLGADSAGNYAGYSAKSGKLVTGSLRDGARPGTTTIRFSGKVDRAQVSVIGGEPVVFNPGSAEIWSSGKIGKLAELKSDASTAKLLASTAASSQILIAYSSGVLAVEPGAERAERVFRTAAVSGLPATPVRVDDCDFLAWSDGQALRSCRGSDVRSFTLAGSAPADAPVIAVNASSVVANDPGTGSTWELRRNGALINNWSDFVDDEVSTETVENERDVPPEIDPQQKPPIAVDDAFGVRAGRGNVLPVLLNDSDPNGDPLIISAVTEISHEVGRLSVVENAQKIQFTPGPEMPAVLSFGYTIDDGHGNTDSATVTLTLRSPEENSPPVQVRPTRSSVAAGGTARISTLDDWVDPDSDPLYLASASTGDPDSVSYSPDGITQFTEAGGSGETRSVALSVSDGTTIGTGLATVTVGAPGSVPLLAESFTATGYADQEIAVRPLDNVRGGTGKVTLTGVSSEGNEGAVLISPDYSSGTFTFSAGKPGNYLAEYSVTDGNLTAAGTVRFAIMPKPEGESIPITVPVTAFLYLQNTTLVDVLAPASDPAGGVLTISSVSAPPEGSGITVEILEHRMLRVTLKSSLNGAPVSLGFVVSNGSTTADGTLTLIEVPEPGRLQPPVANPDAVEVRVGTVAEIPVLDNDVQPNGKPLTLVETLSQDLGPDEGTLFVAGDRLRYLAPRNPGTYVARYRVTSTDGQWAEASVTLTVREVDAANNRPPAPRSLVARVVAGKSVKIPIPLDGIDPDGDAVTLTGASSAPALGAVSGTGRDYIEYTAGAYSGGTDSMEYTVVDALGATGTGTIRIGVIPPGGAAGNPVAMDDLVATRPGTSLSIPVLDNDSDPERGELTIISVEPGSGVTAEVRSNEVSVTAPRTAGSYGVLYTIQNPRGGRSSAWLYIQVADDAPLARPHARDVVLSAQDIVGRDRVLVDPLKQVTFAEGSTRELDLRVEQGFPSATVTEARRIEVTIDAAPQIIPFRVQRKDAPELSSIAFIWVPGSRDTRPELRRDAPPLRVASGESLKIKLDDYVVVARGRSPKLSDPDGVSANHSNGQRLADGQSGIVFVSATGYFGPASVTFTVDDGSGRAGNSATLTLPIEVTPVEDQPPVVNGSAITLEAGSERTVDLQALTDVANSDRRPNLRFTVDSGDRAVVNAQVAGSVLTIRAADGVQTGAQTSVLVSVTDGQLAGKSGAISVQIVSSTRPLVSPIPDSLVIRRGTSDTIDVLANDEATNPFPGKPLRVVSVADGVSLPTGIQLSPSADKRRLTISVDRAGKTGDVTVPYRVADATDDPNRTATGYLSIRVQDVPDAPGAPRLVSSDVATASAVIAIPHAFPNYSDITTYRVSAGEGGPQAECVNPDACVINGLQYGVGYRFRAQAVNALGAGEFGDLGGTVLIDGTPIAPAGVRLDAAASGDRPRLIATWSPGSGGAPGSPIESYDVRVSGPGVELSRTVAATVGTLEIVDGVQATANYTLTVVAKNKTNPGPAASAQMVAVGPPILGDATAEVPSDSPSSTIIVRWNSADGQGSSKLRVRVMRSDQSVVCDQEAGLTAGSCTDNRGGVGSSYTVELSNGLFSTQKTTNTIQRPPTVIGARTESVLDATGDTQIDVRDLRLDKDLGSFRVQYSVRANGQNSGWNDLNGLIRPAQNLFGTSVEVVLRTCRGWGSFWCSDEFTATSPVTPLHTRVDVLTCPVPGQVPTLRGPVNGSVPAALEVRYYANSASGLTPIGPWSAADTPVPSLPGGATSVRVGARATILGYAYDPPQLPTADCTPEPTP